MRTPMTRRAFLSILDRQRSSGLSVREFCMNEAYPSANFYYWKSKFCPSTSRVSPDAGDAELSEDFAPVRFSVPQRQLAPSTAEDLAGSRNGIMLELPSGIKIHFRGTNESKAALGIINQICRSHVLPQ